MSRYRIAPFLMLLCALQACGGGSTSPSSSASSSNNNNPNSHGSMSAIIDGRTWSTNNVGTASFAGGIFSIGGSDPTYILSFAVVATGSGTFVIPGADRQTGQGSQAGNNALLIPVVNGVAQSGWAADITKGSGTIVLTSVTASGATGAFSFLLAPSSSSFGTAGTRAVTNGTFNVRF
jgi:hypothetical protein